MLSEKQPDSTVLYHLKGSAAPSSTTVFHETLGTTLGQDQEWHWAIVQAKGVPSQPRAGQRHKSWLIASSVTCSTSSVFATFQTSIGCVQNFLVLPAFFARHRKVCFALDRIRESIDLSGIGHAIRDLVGLNHGTRREATPA